MAEELIIPNSADRATIYNYLFPQINALVENESDLVANLANISAALKAAFGFFWVGFYLVKEGQLVLGPFQGPIACTRIKYGRGVCGTAWKEAKNQLVPDVEQFKGHIACSSLSVAEIVIPLFDKVGEVIGVLDVDSERYDVLDETDVVYLERICRLITARL